FNRSKILTLVANDITVTKKALKRSNDAKSILDSIYENTYEGIYRKNDARRIEYANSSFLKLFGYKSLKEIPDRSFSSLYADSSIVEELDLRLIKTGSIRNEKILFKKSTGETFWGLKNAAKSISPTGEINYNGAIIDIDNEVKNDALLKQKNDELRVAKEQLDRLLYSASHDLKSPISGMLGLLNLMDMDYGNDHEIHEYLKLLRDCTRRLDGIVDGISNYTLNTRERLRDEAIDVVDLVDGVWEDLKQLYGSEPISFSLKNISNNPSFYSDSGRLKVVIKNILSNSIIYRDEMKKESCIGVELDYQNDHQIITITDNGIGIAKSHVDQVCGMFYKANNKVSGTGLGLYIARETILKLNGSIYITSELQEGTKVVLSIPNSSKGKLILKKRRFKITGQHKPSLK
ncbi:ATP-binding protein, partial [Fulvivirga sp.]